MRARRRHRRVRLTVAVLVSLAGLLLSDQRGLLAVGAGALADEPVAVERPTVSRMRPSLAGGFEALAARLRIATPEALAAPVYSSEALVEWAAPPVDPSGAPVREAAITPPPPAFDGEATPPPPPLELAPSRYDSRTAVGGTWALIIGVNDYPGTRYDLRSAVNDANDMNDALVKMGVTNDRRLVLRDQKADAGTIRAGLDWLTAHAGPGSTMVLFFAGHVQQQREAGREALVASDGGVIPDVEVAAMLDRSPAERAWITIAACFGGGFDEVVRPGRILTAAAPRDRVAYENEGFGRSYLVEYMIRRAILLRGITTVEGAFGWANAELQRDYPDRLPVQVDAVGGDFDLRVHRSSSPPPSQSPPPSGGGSGGGGGQPPPAAPPPSDPEDDGCSALTIGMVRCS